MRSKRGITLVSLVVTIIVLIILAGVSINLTLGENGIITIAKRARENMELAQIDEQTKLNNLYDQIVAEGGVSGNLSNEDASKLAEFKREIASALTDMGIDTEENADASTMASNIRSLTGTSSADKVSYDNTNSELTSTNVQGVVDEIDGKVDGISNSVTNELELIQEVQSNQAVDISNFYDIHCYVYIYATGVYIPVLTPFDGTFYGHVTDANYHNYCNVEKNGNTVKLINAGRGLIGSTTANVLSNSKIKVYGRRRV